jgi:Ca2+-binding EF-hand superfamily protein
MASIVFFEVDLLSQLEVLKSRFDQIPNYSHIAMFKELDSDQDNEINVEDIVNFMMKTGYETSEEDAATIIRRMMFDTSISNNIESICIEEFVNFMIQLQGQNEHKVVKQRTASKHDFTSNFNRVYENIRSERMVPIHQNY